MLTLVCFSCNDDEDPHADKASSHSRVSRSNNLEIIKEESNKKFSFAMGAEIDEKLIIAVNTRVIRPTGRTPLSSIIQRTGMLNR